MASAVEQVFQLPELLEVILLHLPQRDILFSQRVNMLFRDTILNSQKIQRVLFFLPDWKLEAAVYNAYAVYNRPGKRPENNRLLFRVFSGCYPTITSASSTIESSDSSDEAVSPDTKSTAEHWSWSVCIAWPSESAPSYNQAVHYPEASWKRMLLSQPPPTELHLIRRWQRSRKPAIVRQNGITLGDFVEESSKPQTTWHRSYISSDGDWHFEGDIKCSSYQRSSFNA